MCLTQHPMAICITFPHPFLIYANINLPLGKQPTCPAGVMSCSAPLFLLIWPFLATIMAKTSCHLNNDFTLGPGGAFAFFVASCSFLVLALFFQEILLLKGGCACMQNETWEVFDYFFGEESQQEDTIKLSQLDWCSWVLFHWLDTTGDWTPGGGRPRGWKQVKERYQKRAPFGPKARHVDHWM